tara:strand:+ start:9989 stop:10195 length:207 start_codon:yes stop_codon:yes gene_type:complete
MDSCEQVNFSTIIADLRELSKKYQKDANPKTLGLLLHLIDDYLLLPKGAILVETDSESVFSDEEYAEA